MTPQQSRVLRALIQRGPHGITRVDFQAPTIDGGAPILNFPARIEQLRKMGYAIPPSTERRNNCNVYVLGSAESQQLVDSVLPPPDPEPSYEPGGLFSMPEQSRSAIYDEDAA